MTLRHSITLAGTRRSASFVDVYCAAALWRGGAVRVTATLWRVSQEEKYKYYDNEAGGYLPYKRENVLRKHAVRLPLPATSIAATAAAT